MKRNQLIPIASVAFLCASLLLLVAASTARSTIIVNGDFEAGNTGFTSEYTYVPPGPGSLDLEERYTVDTDPQQNNNTFLSIGDHTTGTGLMMIINASETTGAVVWQGTTSSSLTVGEQYDFSFWVAILRDRPASLTVTLGSTSIDVPVPEADGIWRRMALTFTADVAHPILGVGVSADFAGLGFALDDMDVFLVGTTTNPPPPTPTPTPSPSPSPTPAKLQNISTRLQVLTGDQVLIGGFIITGDDPKMVILRALGPSLSDFGITNALADPVLELRGADGSLITSNDNWKANQAAVEATGLQPSKDLESAIVATLDPGAYTAIVTGKNGGTGVGLVEAYDLDSAAASELGNISTRGFVDTGNNVMIGGFILEGEANVLIRVLGPSLTDFGVTGALADPTVELRDAQGTLISSNDNWKEGGQQSDITATGLQPQKDKESALIETLSAGAYTAIVAGQTSTTGVGLVEVYRLP